MSAADDPRFSANVQRCIDRIRVVAREFGWAIGEHGSRLRDIDLIGVPWTAEARPPLDLIFALCDRLHFERGKIENKPHHRIGFSLLGGETMAEYVDLSLVWPHPMIE